MERQSTSTFLTNQLFDRWLDDRLDNIKKLTREGTPTYAASLDAKHLLQHFDFRAIPFLTYDPQRPVRVKIKVGVDGEEIKGTLSIIGSLPAPQVFVISPRYGRTPQALAKNANILRYKPFKSKRWRTPKDYHQDQIAFYTLRYK